MIYLIISTVAIIGSIVFFIHGKERIKVVVVPSIFLLIADLQFLIAKFAVGDDFLTIILYFPATLCFLIGCVWMTVLLVKSFKHKDSKRVIASMIILALISLAIIPIPSLKKDDKYKIYKSTYYQVADAIFNAYDAKKIKIGDQFQSPPYATYDMDRISVNFEKDIINCMKKLNKNAGVYTYIMADDDVVYFSFGANFQSVEGIAICRKGENPNNNEKLRSKYFDGSPHYNCIENGVYHFYDGL